MTNVNNIDLTTLREHTTELCNKFIPIAVDAFKKGRKNGLDKIVPDAMAGALAWVVIKEFYPPLDTDAEAKLFLELKDLVMNALFDRVSKDVELNRVMLTINQSEDEKK